MQGVEHVPCTLLFMCIYFFSMASAVWWVILTLTWFLSACFKWGHESIEHMSAYFHLAAWAIPGAKMIAVLWMQRVDADILSGTCMIGIRSMSMLRAFVLTPLVGTVFLLSGFFSLFRIRHAMRSEGNRTDKLEKFMVRIGVFSILYMIPAVLVIACYFYELASYDAWIDTWLTRHSVDFNLPPDYVSAASSTRPPQTIVFSVFMLKYAMLLVVGITSGFWIWSHKTISSWQRFGERLWSCCCGQLLVSSGLVGAGGAKYKNEAAV